jgi:hypothetical protein
MIKIENPSKKLMNAALLLIPLTLGIANANPILDAQQLLQAQTFWVNKDFDWYENNIPIFDSPDAEINTTYYYRWELVTRHFVYGNPNTGYAFTEFANRPPWSGAYGTISCPAGLQINDVRWLQDPRYVRDYLRFWMRNPGAQPRNYSFWPADSAWSAHQVQPNDAFITDLLPDLISNYNGWVNRGWVSSMNLFWQLGHDDGMEFDINAQQTNDILRGGQSLRPSFNSYMWADAKAIANIAALDNKPTIVSDFTNKAQTLKTAVQTQLWDPSREFFFPMSNQRHVKNGHIVEKHTLTYETGQFAGSIHGRELHGYVPWMFNLPDAGYENAWQFLMDDAFFKSDFGPTTVEQNDPLFSINHGCCWWSGQSWPFATAQTLKAMSNLLHNYSQTHVDKQDYTDLLHTFSISQRKDGRPYIAEALNPFTGSWNGHDFTNRSEHYFHSSFTDLVITGLVGIEPAVGNTLTVEPLAPDSWDYFALDRVNYHGHDLAVTWDRDGSRYGVGAGLRVFVNGTELASSPTLGKLTVTLPAANVIPVDPHPEMNYAVNNDGDYYPRHQASFSGAGSALADIADGQYVYDVRPTNRWTAVGSPDPQDWVEVDFGTQRPINRVKLYLLDDSGVPYGNNSPVRAPEAISLEYWTGSAWDAVPNQTTSSPTPQGRTPFTITFPELNVSKLRAILDHSGTFRSGLTELEAWGPGQTPSYLPALPPAGNIAFNQDGSGFPKATASYSDRFGGMPKRAIDGKIIFKSTPMNRWTAYESPNSQDWFQVEFENLETIARAVLHIYDDGGGVQTPASYNVEAWLNGSWVPVSNPIKNPAVPVGGGPNVVEFSAVETTKIRILFNHKGNSRSGMTELELWSNTTGIDPDGEANSVLSGIVTNRSNGTPISGATVYFSPTPSAPLNPLYTTTTTDPSGHFVRNLQNGKWYISVDALGFFPTADRTATIDDADHPNFDFTMTPQIGVVPRKADLWFSCVTDALPNFGSIAAWPTYEPAGSFLTLLNSPSVELINGVKWVQNQHADNDGFDQGTYTSAVAVNGATIVVAVIPERVVPYNDPWTSVVDIMYDRLVLGVHNGTGKVNVRRNGVQNTSSTTIPAGQITILSLVCQPDGTYKVWANGNEVMDIDSTSTMTSILPGVAGPYANHITVGRNSPDGWPTFNGNIGDVFVYKVALSNEERQQLEGYLSNKFITHIVTASAGSGGSISPVGAVQIGDKGNQTFTISPNPGFQISEVKVDAVSQGAISSYTFSNVVADHLIEATFLGAPAQTGASPLRISFNAAGGLDITWPDNFTGQLLKSPTLGENADWQPVTQVPVQSNGSFKITVIPSVTTMFYRLKL